MQAKADFNWPTILDSEFQERIARFKAKMIDARLDLVVIYSNLLDPSAVRYFADVAGINESSAIVMPLEGEAILCSGQACHEWSRFKSHIKDIRIMPEVGEVSGVEYNIEVTDFEDLFREVRDKYQIRRIGIIGDFIFPQIIYGKMQRVWPDAEKASAEDLMYDLRMTKSENELACIRTAGKIITQTFEYAVPRIRPGVTELDIQADIEGEMLRLGAESYSGSWAPMIPTGPQRSNLCMNRNTLRPVQESEIIDLAAGAVYEGYNAVICTPVVLGPIPDEIKRAVNTAREGVSLVAHNLRPGATSRELFAIYSNFLEKTGYREFGP